MKNSMLVVASVSMLAATAAHAGPVGHFTTNTALAMPQLKGIALTPMALPSTGAIKLKSLPGQRTIQLVRDTYRGGAGGPCTSRDCGPPELPGLPRELPPLFGYWFYYDTEIYPGELAGWAQGFLVNAQVTTISLVNELVDPPCYSDGNCGPDDPLGFVDSYQRFLGDAGEKALGIVKGPGSPPLPKMPGPDPA